MRTHDIHMGAAIDEENRIILLTGSIDRNDHSIVLRIPVPSNGEWTIIKAEVNITDEPWTGWQINIGEGASVALKGDKPELLMSRHFANSRYLPEQNSVVFYGDAEIRPGDAILKYTKLNVINNQVELSHNRACPRHEGAINKMLKDASFGREFPKVEVDVPVSQINAPDTLEILQKK